MGAARGLMCILVALDLAAIKVWWSARDQTLCICFLIDMSESVSDTNLEQVYAVLNQTSSLLGTSRQVATVGFDSEATVLAQPEITLEVDKIRNAITERRKTGEDPSEEPRAPGTNLEKAFSLAVSLFPPDSQKRIVIFSDGNETDGDALSQAIHAADQKIEISVVPLEPAVEPDVLVRQLAVPERVKLREAFKVRGSLVSSTSVPGRAKLFLDGYMVESLDVKLSEGENNVAFNVSVQRAGRHLFRLHFESDIPQSPSNDDAYAFVDIPGIPRVLILEKNRKDGQYLFAALQQSQFQVDRRPIRGVPRTMVDLLNYDAVLICNIPATDLDDNQMKLFRDYVYDFGGGLVMVGGENSFAAGDYAGTHLEALSPVETRLREKEKPSTGLVMVMDSSRSMYLQPSGMNKQAFVREAFKNVVLGLSERDYIGAIGYSSELIAAKWSVRMQRVIDKAMVINQFNRNFVFDTYSNLYRSLDEARRELANQPTTYKHIVVITDGFVEPGYDYPKFATQLTSDNITISTIAVGGDSNLKLLKRIARWGNGRFHLATTQKDVTEVFRRELAEVQTQKVVEHPLKPEVRENDPILRGLDINLAPYLFGYARARPKLEAKTILVAEKSPDPLLASWTFGAGKVAAFTSDAKERWAYLWVTDWGKGFRRFWSQLVTSVLRKPKDVSLLPHLQADGYRLNVDIDAVTGDNRFVNSGSYRAQLFYLGRQGYLFSRAAVTHLPLSQTAPGRYSHEHQVRKPGVYLIKALGENDEMATAGAIVQSSREQTSLTLNKNLLRRMTELTEGSYGITARQITRSTPAKQQRRVDFGIFCMTLTAFLLFGEILIRRWPAVEEYLAEKRRAQGTVASSQ